MFCLWILLGDYHYVPSCFAWIFSSIYLNRKANNKWRSITMLAVISNSSNHKLEYHKITHRNNKCVPCNCLCHLERATVVLLTACRVFLSLIVSIFGLFFLQMLCMCWQKSEYVCLICLCFVHMATFKPKNDGLDSNNSIVVVLKYKKRKTSVNWQITI